MTSPSEDRLRRAVDELLTVCWNEDIPLLDALGEALDDWWALSTVELGGPTSDVPAVGSMSLSEEIRSIEEVSWGRPKLTVECALADAVLSWLAVGGE